MRFGLILLLAGCFGVDGEGDDGEGDDGGGAAVGGADGGGADGGGEAVVCHDVPLDACDGTPGCMSLWALPVVEWSDGELCVDHSVDEVKVGCVVAKDCGQAEILATPADTPAECSWYFNEYCIPDDFVACEVTWAPVCE